MSENELKIATLKSLVESYMQNSEKDSMVINQLRNTVKDLELKLLKNENELTTCREALGQCRRDREQLVERVNFLRANTSHNAEKTLNKAVEKYNNLVKDSKKLIELQSRYLYSYKMTDKAEYEKFKVEFKNKIYNT